MVIVKLISFQPEAEMAQKALTLWREGRVIDATPLQRLTSVVGEVAAIAPAAVVFDLDKLPSRARELSGMLRDSRAAGRIPQLFVGGEAAKIERLRGENPDAVFASWVDAPAALTSLLMVDRSAAKRTPQRAVRSAYTGTPLAEKLGIVTAKPTVRRVTLLGAPEHFRGLLGHVPDEVTFTKKLANDTALAVVFVRSLTELQAAFELLATRMPEGCSAWMVYPKRQHKPGFHENDVRAAGLALGLVDYKICSIDQDWSGMKFARRKS